MWLIDENCSINEFCLIWNFIELSSLLAWKTGIILIQNSEFRILFDPKSIEEVSSADEGFAKLKSANESDEKTK